MSRDILNERDDHSKVFRRGNPHVRRLQHLLGLVASILCCNVGKTLAEKFLQFCIYKLIREILKKV